MSTFPQGLPAARGMEQTAEVIDGPQPDTHLFFGFFLSCFLVLVFKHSSNHCSCGVPFLGVKMTMISRQQVDLSSLSSHSKVRRL